MFRTSARLKIAVPLVEELSQQIIQLVNVDFGNTIQLEQASARLDELIRCREMKKEVIARVVPAISQDSYSDQFRLFYNVLRAYPKYLDRAVETLAASGKGDLKQAEVINLLLSNEYGADINSAVSGYARKGLFFRVNQLLAQGGDKDSAVYAYAFGGHTQLVERLVGGQIAEFGDLIIKGYRDGGHFDNDAGKLKILALTDQLELRKSIANVLFEKDPAQLNRVLAETAKLNELMKEYQLKFDVLVPLFTAVLAIEAKYKPGMIWGFFEPEISDENKAKMRDEIMALSEQYEQKARSQAAPAPVLTPTSGMN